MYTHKDIACRTIFVINSLEEKSLKVINGALMLQDSLKEKTLTKLPFQKILALFVIGHTTITSPLIEKCTKHSIPLVVLKYNLRPIFFFSITAEANYLLRQRQHEWDTTSLQIPKILVTNKIKNQLRLLEKTRLKTADMQNAQASLSQALESITTTTDYDRLMGIEGSAAKTFFSVYFGDYNWKIRDPRTKIDPINSVLDIGYTILFNYVETFVRLFGFDPYIGVYHRLWFKRKSLICDLMEPFRCIIDQQIRKAFNTNQFKYEDFRLFKNEYQLKQDKNSQYNKIFFDALIEHKMELFKYIRSYYRCFMQKKSSSEFPDFLVK